MKILIADDEPLARERLARLCSEIGDYSIIAEAQHGKQVLELIPQCKPDVILLDIRMPGMDGIETAQHIAKLDTPPAIIFTTAYDQYALEAFDNHAVGYLLKPINKDKLADSLNAAEKLTQAQISALQTETDTSQPSHISARVQGNIQLIPLETIRYFRADQKYVSVCYFEDNRSHEVLIEEPLKTLEQMLKQSFIRIHRNALIAECYLTGLDKDKDGAFWICLKDIDDKLEVSRRHVPEVRKIIKNKSIS